MAPKFTIRHDKKVKVLRDTDVVPAGTIAYVHAMRVNENNKAEYLLRKEKRANGGTFHPLGVTTLDNLEEQE